MVRWMKHKKEKKRKKKEERKDYAFWHSLYKSWRMRYIGVPCRWMKRC